MVAGPGRKTDINTVPQSNDELQRVVDFILNHADPGQLDVLRAALDRRQAGGPTSQNPNAMDFQEMARRTISGHGGLQGHMQMPDVSSMTRNLVRGMIKDQAPEIGEQELEILLEKWVPSGGKQAPHSGAEDSLPRDALMNMVRQFLHYSDGRMVDRELRELKAAAHDWPKRYWEVFSDRTRELLAHCINGQISEKEFWKAMQQG